MNHITILLIKFITCLIAFTIGLDLFFEATMTDIVAFSLLVTTVSYLIGDRILLPRLGNINSVIVDFMISYTIVWIFGSVLLNNYLQIAWGSMIAAVIISTAEVVLHRFILTGNSEDRMIRRNGLTINYPAYGVEMAEEQDPLKKK
jgi:hypothetical protein